MIARFPGRIAFIIHFNDGFLILFLNVDFRVERIADGYYCDASNEM